MAAPALRIPFSMSLDEFQKNVDSAKSHTRQLTQFALKQFQEMNTAIGGSVAASIGASFAAMALRTIGIIGGIIVATKAMGDVIEQVRDRIAEMVEVSEKATQRGLSPEFFQAFTSAARGAEERVELLEAALDRAWQATKPVLNPDWTVWDRGLEKITDVENALRGMRELFSTDQKYTGLDLFRSANTQDEKVRAVLVAMRELNTIGQQVAAIDLAEKMFGNKFADEVRRGKQSIDDLFRSIDDRAGKTFISDANAKAAKELDDRLNDAWHTIHERLKPDWDDLASIALRIKSVWADIVQAIANAHLGIKTLPAYQIGDVGEGTGQDDPNGAVTANARIIAQRRRMLRNRGIIPESGIFPDGIGPDAWPSPGSYTPPSNYPALDPRGRPMLPMSRPDGAPKAKEDSGYEARDQFEISIDSITKHIATLNADTAAMFQNNAARQQFRAEFQALTAIMRDGGEVTQDQIDAYEKFRQSMSAAQALEAAGIQLTKEHSEAFLRASDNIRKAASARDQAAATLERLNSASSQFGSALSNAFSEAVIQGKSLNEVLSNLLRTLGNSAINSLFASLFNAPAGGGLSPFASLLKGLWPGFAEGTDYAPGGLAWVGENGKELVNLPRGSQVIPNDIVRSGMGSISAAMTFNIDARGADQGAIARLQAQLLKLKAELPVTVVNTVRQAQKTRNL
jgi:hypothetical protein